MSSKAFRCGKQRGEMRFLSLPQKTDFEVKISTPPSSESRKGIFVDSEEDAGDKPREQ